MKKNINYILSIISALSYNALGFITDEILSTKTTDNISSSGIIIQKEYQSELDINTKIIKTYSYINHTNDSDNYSAANLDKPAKMLFALIPSTAKYTERPGSDIASDQILRMNIYLNEFCKREKLTTRELYSLDCNLGNSFTIAKKAMLIKALQGSHGLFMPENIEKLRKFNGISKLLEVAVTAIEDLLLTINDFNSTSINKEQVIALQNQIFDLAAGAKTVIFIPECISVKNSGKLRLPIAMINKVTLNQENKTITLNLLFHQNIRENYISFFDFIEARKTLFTGASNTADQWEFLDYTLKIADNNTQLNYYIFSGAKVNNLGHIQQNKIIQQCELSSNNSENCVKDNIVLLDKAIAIMKTEILDSSDVTNPLFNICPGIFNSPQNPSISGS